MDSWANDFGGFWTLLFIGAMGYWFVTSVYELTRDWFKKRHPPHSQ